MTDLKEILAGIRIHDIRRIEGKWRIRFLDRDDPFTLTYPDVSRVSEAVTWILLGRSDAVSPVVDVETLIEGHGEMSDEKHYGHLIHPWCPRCSKRWWEHITDAGWKAPAKSLFKHIQVEER